MQDEPLVSDATLAELERLADHASPMPWVAFVASRELSSGDDVIVVGRDEYMLVSKDTGPASPDDLDFIAAARNHLPRLIAEIRRLRGHS